MNNTTNDVEVPLKHSGLGIASFAMVVVFGLLLIFILGYAGYLEMNTPGGVDEESPEAIIAGLTMFLAAGMIFVAFVLGVVGLFVGKRKRLFAGLGVGLSACLILLTIMLLVIGSLAP